VIVPVGVGRPVLDWAAAEAAERGAELHVVHAFQWARQVDASGYPTVDLQARIDAEAFVAAAIRRVRRSMPTLRIKACVYAGRQVTALISEARNSVDALVVLDHTPGRIPMRRLLRRTSASLAVVCLSPPGFAARATGQVVVGVDATGGPASVLGFAFRAARRRGIGVTIVHALSSPDVQEIEDTVRIWQTAYPEVPVRWSIDTGTVDSLLLAESTGAALTVLGPDRHNWLHRALRGSPTSTVLRLNRGPLVIVRPPGS
jgi:nucleotide-binding universal stress UspA family protein